MHSGKRLASLLDLVLSPCDNFYEYVCATWVEEHPVPRNAERVSYRTSLVDYVERRLDEVVRGERVIARFFSLLEGHAVIADSAFLKKEKGKEYLTGRFFILLSITRE